MPEPTYLFYLRMQKENTLVERKEQKKLHQLPTSPPRTTEDN